MKKLDSKDLGNRSTVTKEAGAANRTCAKDEYKQTP